VEKPALSAAISLVLRSHLAKLISCTQNLQPCRLTVNHSRMCYFRPRSNHQTYTPDWEWYFKWW